MKSTLYAAMIAAAAFSLTACKEKTAEMPTPEETPAATTEAPAAPAAPEAMPAPEAPAAPAEEPKKEEAPAAH